MGRVREGINYKIKVTATTQHGESVTELTEDVYNTFDDLMLFYCEKQGYELFADIPEEVSLHRGINTIVDERTDDCTFTYELVL